MPRLTSPNLMSICSFINADTLFSLIQVNHRIGKIIKKFDTIPYHEATSVELTFVKIKKLRRMIPKASKIITDIQTLSLIDENLLKGIKIIQLKTSTPSNPSIIQKYVDKLIEAPYSGKFEYKFPQRLSIKIQSSIVIVIHRISAPSHFTFVEESLTKMLSTVHHFLDINATLRIPPFVITPSSFQSIVKNLSEHSEDCLSVTNEFSHAKQIVMKKALNYADKQLSYTNTSLFDQILPSVVTICSVNSVDLDLQQYTTITSLQYDVYNGSSKLLLPSKLIKLSISQTCPILSSIPTTLNVLYLGESPSQRPMDETRKLSISNDLLPLISVTHLKEVHINTSNLSGDLRFGDLKVLELRNVNSTSSVYCNQLDYLTLVDTEARVVVSDENTFQYFETDLNHVNICSKKLSATKSVKIIDCSLEELYLDYFQHAPCIMLEKVDSKYIQLDVNSIKYLIIEACPNITNEGLPSKETLTNLQYSYFSNCDHLETLRDN
ncbi:F-box domain-containing protein [Entamoeba marina]